MDTTGSGLASLCFAAGLGQSLAVAGAATTSPPFVPPGGVHIVAPYPTADLAHVPRGAPDVLPWPVLPRAL